MQSTKVKLIDALKLLGIMVKTSLTKDELEDIYYNFFNTDEIDRLTYILDVNTYKLLEKLVENGFVKISNQDIASASVLSNILVINEDKKQLELTNTISICKEVKESLSRFVNDKNKATIIRYSKMVDIAKKVISVYGVMEIDFEFLNMVMDKIDFACSRNELYYLINYNLDLRSFVYIIKYDDEYYIYFKIIHDAERIIDEIKVREQKRKVYKSMESLTNNTYQNLINKKESKEVIEYLKNKECSYPKDIVLAYIYEFVQKCDMNPAELFYKEDLKFDDEDDANNFLQLLMNLYNNIPQYCLGGYSPAELFKRKIEKEKKAIEKEKNAKIGRNQPCPCRLR